MNSPNFKTTLLLAFLVMLFFGLINAQEAQVPQASTLSFPIPPQQNTPWSLSEEIEDPEGLIAQRINALFENGMADPRGLPYHFVKVREGEELKMARGWVLPAKEGEKQRYAIGWTGLIYPVEEVSEKLANLELDCDTLQAHGTFSQQKHPPSPWSKKRDIPQMIDAWAKSELLLRLGRPLDNEKYAWASDSHYPFLAYWAKSVLEDGVGAFVAENDALAVARLNLHDKLMAKLLVDHPLPVELEKKKQKELSYHIQTIHAMAKSPLRDCLVDAKRRLEPVQPLPASKSEIEQAIASWDELREWDVRNPPPSYLKVIRSGAMAIEPLLKCLEEDKRWTRSVGEEDSFGRTPELLRVADVAAMAFSQVLDFPFPELDYRYYDEPRSTEEYQELGKKMRAFCKRYDYQVGGELWFRVLADQEADLEHQAYAAIAITRIAHDRYFIPIRSEKVMLLKTDEIFDVYEFRPRTSPPRFEIRESLLERKEPSIAELLKKAWVRERKLVDQGLSLGRDKGFEFPVTPGDDAPRLLYSRAHLFVHCMEEISPGNLEVLREHYDWMLKGLSKPPGGRLSSEIWLHLPYLEEVLIRRFELEDWTVLSDYEDFIELSLNGKFTPPLLPMQAYPDHRHMDGVARNIFDNEESLFCFSNESFAWYSLLARSIKGNEYGYFAENLSLLAVPTIREGLLKGLENKKVVGIYRNYKKGTDLDLGDKQQDWSEARDYNNWGHPWDEDEKPEWEVEVRYCDLVANLLNMDGVEKWITPKFSFADSLEKRDQVISLWIQILEMNEE